MPNVPRPVHLLYFTARLSISSAGQLPAGSHLVLLLTSSRRSTGSCPTCRAPSHRQRVAPPSLLRLLSALLCAGRPCATTYLGSKRPPLTSKKPVWDVLPVIDVTRERSYWQACSIDPARSSRCWLHRHDIGVSGAAWIGVSGRHMPATSTMSLQQASAVCYRHDFARSHVSLSVTELRYVV